MKHPAKVRFVGNPKDDRNIKGKEQAIILDQTIHFDKDGNALEDGPIACHEITDNDPNDFTDCFTFGKLYPAYFLEFWQGKRINLHVKNDLGEISNFNNINDFDLVEDVDDVLNTKEAIVRCITHKFDDKLFDLNYGNEYIAIGVTDQQFSDFDYLVIDECHDCYFYSADYFEVVSDPYGLLDKKIGQYVYDWISLFYDGDDETSL